MFNDLFDGYFQLSGLSMRLALPSSTVFCHPPFMEQPHSNESICLIASNPNNLGHPSARAQRIRTPDDLGTSVRPVFQLRPFAISQQ